MSIMVGVDFFTRDLVFHSGSLLHHLALHVRAGLVQAWGRAEGAHRQYRLDVIGRSAHHRRRRNQGPWHPTAQREGAEEMR